MEQVRKKTISKKKKQVHQNAPTAGETQSEIAEEASNEHNLIIENNLEDDSNCEGISLPEEDNGLVGKECATSTEYDTSKISKVDSRPEHMMTVCNDLSTKIHVTDKDHFERLLNSNKDILNTIKLSDVPSIETVNNIRNPTDTVIIKPFTELQLNALYTNEELDRLDDFISHYVDAELKGLAIKKHPLYELLSSYLKISEKITGNNLELDQLRREYKALENELWTIETATVSGKGECQDRVTVTASQNYSKSVFHRSVFQSIARILVNIQKLVYENHTLYSYSAQEVKMQIKLYLHQVISNCLTVSQLAPDAPVALTLQDEPTHLKPYFNEIRICISVLFAFQRKLIREAEFIEDTRKWLSRLIAILLRVANYQDHLFILSHVLRCPAGISTWASNYIQMPLSKETLESPFSNYQIHHILTILAALLSPVKGRELFLDDIAQGRDMAADALWVMVDSEGEEDDEPTGTSLKENDLVALLNQIPLDDLFRRILLVEKRDFQDTLNPNDITENHILRYLALSTVLLRIVHRGMKIYNQPRYNQFSKRLSRFIRHITQYATDLWELFVKMRTLEDKAMLQRLQVEYDSFFLRAIYSLYSSQKLGAWQFLAVIPYNMVTMKTLWKVFYFLHGIDTKAEFILDTSDQTDYSTRIWEDELWTQFEEKLSTLEDAEIYYLLNTFANMALARTEADMEFIQSAMIDLLKIGFINQSTQDSCSKSSRILLTHITSKYPHLLSNVLKEVEDHIDKIGPFALYLYEDLPLSVWKIADCDIEILSKLLLNAATTNESKLARMILSRLNWDEICYDIHCDVALLAVAATFNEPAIEPWAWQTILRLKLHISDKAFQEIGRAQDVDSYDVLRKGIREQHPLATFVSILMTSWGHLIPLIGTKGLPLLLFLQSHQKHEAVLFALYQIVPMFIESQECLINCEKFQEILVNLLNADRGYIYMAKSLVYTQHQTVLQQFGNMVETQIVNYTFYGLESPRLLVRLWMNSFVSIAGWYRDMGVMYLLNVIIKTAFLNSDCIEVVYNILREQHQCSSPLEGGGTITSLFKWVTNSPPANGTLLSSALYNYTWLAYMMIAIEFDEREVHPGLWNEILVQLSRQSGKISVDQAIKKAASTLNLPSFTSGYLTIYRWSQQALDTPLDHPLLPLLWQRFFTLYLARISASSIDKPCVGERFFDGMVNFAFMKKIKRRLQETVDYFQSKLNLKDEENEEIGKKSFHKACHSVFRAFLLWLEEPRLQEDSILLKDLPPQYESELLSRILQGNNAPWYEFLDYDRLKTEQQVAIKSWRIANFREKKNINRPLINAGSRVESDDPLERILRRLTSYDCPKPPPVMQVSAPVVPQVQFGSRPEMFKSLEQCFKTFTQFAHNHNLKQSEQKSLDCAYKDLAPQLYRSVLNKVKKIVPCKGKNQTVHCSGVAVIVLEFQEARMNERIDHQIQANRSNYESLLTSVLQPCSQSLCTAAVTLQQTIKMLQSQLRCNPSSAELGVELFYYILSLVNEETNAYPPTKTLFACCLERLGQSHIYGIEYEMPRLLNKILSEPNLGGHLAPHFSPAKVGSSSLLLMYNTICKEIGSKYDVAFALLSKFDIETWLNTKNPVLAQKSSFVQYVIAGLTSLGLEPPMEAFTLHGLYKKHLLTVLEHKFPDHYGEVLMSLLKASSGNPESNLIAISVWMDVLNFLAKPATVDLKAPFREQLRNYAQYQKVLNNQQLLETAEMLGRHFTQERLQYGLYGLYPKCRSYIDVFVLLLGMVGHGIVTSAFNAHQDLSGNQLCEKIWPQLREMFTPWLVPYSMQNFKENMASWIQQLADDRQVILPWISADTNFAQKVLNVFRECVLFVLHIIPGSGSILSLFWQWYVSSYAHNSVKDHIFIPVHQTFLSFPWNNFWPSMVDVELMLRIVDQYLPECHAFLGHIFVLIPWSEWLKNFSTAPPQLKVRVYQCLINLIVKLSNEPNIKKNHSERAKSLLVEAENFDWDVLEAPLYQHVMDWYVMSCDSAVIFKTDPLDLDYRVLNFLKTVSSTNSAEPSPDSLNKRLIFLKTYIKLLSVYVNRHRTNISRKEQEIYTLIARLFNELEYTTASEDDMTALLKELLCVLNIEDIRGPALNAVSKWAEGKCGDTITVRSLLKSLGIAVKNYESLAEVLEVTVNSYFANAVTNEFEPTWTEISSLLNLSVTRQSELEQVLLAKGSILTLNAILLQRVSKGIDNEALMKQCLDWLCNIKPSGTTESKIPLIWLILLDLVIKNAERNERFCAVVLHKFSQILLEISEERAASRWGKGLLSAIGLAKQDDISIQFKFLCRALAGYILAQLPEPKGECRTIRKSANDPCKVGQPGGNTECVKVLMGLDFGHSQGKIKECAEAALKQIQDPNNSLHSIRRFLMLFVVQFYTKPFIKDMESCT
nr:unnamed protein product [Callosobruchus chinensis]